MFRTATFKLTVWYLAIAMAISLVFSAVVYRVGSGELDRGLNRQSQRIYRDFPVFDDSPYLQPRRDIVTAEHHLLAQLVFFNLLVLAGAGLASYLLAKRTLEPIEAAHARQKRFTADVSHELRTPITALKMEAEVALMDTGAGKASLKKALQSNIDEANKLDSLINNLLRLSRLEAGEVRLGFESLNLSELMDEALADNRKTAGKRNIKIEGKPAGIVTGDRESLVQLLTILLDNAIKYSPANTTIQLESSDKGDTVSVSVKDQGVGIEREALEHVFDRFFRADSSRYASSSEGFGLGLSIAKMIADLHHATITLSSRVGHGTTATVTLPKHSKNA